MIIRDMNLSLIIACVVIVLALIVLPLIVSYKAEKEEKDNKNEWDKIKEYGNKINNKTRERYK
jgi:NADH:ubiquinone oxidoreductase subunit 6 (subunit J)|tara:strand:- start:974 stop:1162 length:189 start_codon:yes stop_codon:yes gene_type:complete